MIDEGIGVLVYTMLDAIVDAYFPILDGIVDRIEDLEEAILSGSAGRGATRGTCATCSWSRRTCRRCAGWWPRSATPCWC